MTPMACRLLMTEDETVGHTLICIWSLLTGRTLRRVPPSELTEQELIDFWTDDLSSASGRHAARSADADGDAR